MSKQTPWMPAEVNPFHKGIYLRKHLRGNLLYAYWDGRVWYVGASHKETALGEYKRRNESMWSRLPWRGLAQPPHMRRNIGAAVSMIANANPTWGHSHVLSLAKNLVTCEKITMTFHGMKWSVPNPFYDNQEN